ncbi:hypothetical protein DK37_29460 [Halomonas sp. SUBG004]|nr:hypothetical protein DK37_29460 [Halomonas sp. SUBG004]
MVKKVAGDDANVTVLTPINAEVHEWELTPDNFAALEDADIVFFITAISSSSGCAKYRRRSTMTYL